MAHSGQVIAGQGGFRLHLLRVDPRRCSSWRRRAPRPCPRRPPTSTRARTSGSRCSRAPCVTRIGDVERTYEAGDRFDVPAGTSHQVSAQGAARMRWEIRPALRTAECFERLYGGQAGEGFLEGFADEIRLT